MKNSIRLLSILFVQFFTACAVNPQVSTSAKNNDGVKPAVVEEQKPMMAFNFPPEVIQQAKDRFIELDSLTVVNGRMVSKHWNGSAGLIDSSHALTNFHVLNAGIVTAEVGKIGPLGAEFYEVMEAAPSNYHVDLAIFTIQNEDKLKLNLSPIRLAKEVVQGEVLANYSNADGQSGFLDYFVVSKVKDNGTFLVSRPFKMGSSGSLLYNSLGEVVGIVDEIKMGGNEENNYPIYGIAIHRDTIEGYIKSIAPFLKAYDEIRKQMSTPSK